MPFETSTLFVKSLADALKQCGHLERVAATVPPEVRASLLDPNARRVHRGDVPLCVCTALADGPIIEEVFAVQTQRTLGPVAAPLMKVALALTGNSPATAFARLDDVLGVMMKGVTAAWTPTSTSAGVVSITYPATVQLDGYAAHGWAGALRYAYELAGVPGTTKAATSAGRVASVEAAWTKG